MAANFKVQASFGTLAGRVKEAISTKATLPGNVSFGIKGGDTLRIAEQLDVAISARYGENLARSPREPLRGNFKLKFPGRDICYYRKVSGGYVNQKISRLWRVQPRCSVTGKDVEMMDSEHQDAVELKNAASFEQIATEGGFISICGFGSLLSERSARFTFPELQNFRVGILHGFRRVFAHVAPVFLERGIANVETKEMSSLSVEPFPGESIVVTVFEISESEVPAFIEREHEFRFLAITVHSLEGEISAHKALLLDSLLGKVICARYSDEEYRRDRCSGDEEYNKRYGRYNIQRIWRDDIFPCRTYLRHCVLAAKNLNQAAYDSFLDHTFLGDRTTSIRQYLAQDENIMLEEPPLALRERYGG
ncbi:hypothetical protein R1sor_018140 [Riccia sorocarpa]|uniref:Uncharacterized protein n=1 Tax=Riccia sorocarpa TaxID=122646 RepID=A0ABD3I8V7_9MARC